MNIVKKCAAEFIGTFVIVFIGCGAVMANVISEGQVSHSGVAVSFGLAVMTMIYAVGHISGAHFNPAVTIAFSCVRHFPKNEILPYIMAQCLGAISASGIMLVILKVSSTIPLIDTSKALAVTQPLTDPFLTGFLPEAILTFLLMFVIMAVATDYRAVGNMAGLAIGGTVLMEAMTFGPICGASMNPARSLGPALVSGEWNHILIYILGPIVGAVLGAVVYSLIRCEDRKDVDVKGCC